MASTGLDHEETEYNFCVFEKDFLRPSKTVAIHDRNNNETEVENEDFPEWLEPKLIQEGQAFVRKYFFSIFFAHFVSLIFLLCYTPVRLILIRTARSNTAVKALKRYVSTLVHIKQWYEGDLLESGGRNHDLSKVRRLHARLGQSLNSWHFSKAQPSNTVPEIHEGDRIFLEAIHSDFQESFVPARSFQPESDDEMTPTISQFDMAVTQFCFMGFLSLFPKAFGISDLKGLDGFVHVWALIGSRLGIQDRFNICLTINHRYRRHILHNILLPEMSKCGSDTLILWTSLVSGIGKFVPFISLKSILFFILKNILETSGSELNSRRSVYDCVCYALMSRCFNIWISFSPIRITLNNLLRLAVYLTIVLRFPSNFNRN